MSKSLIRKNQLHPDIADLVSGYGDEFFITSGTIDDFVLGSLYSYIPGFINVENNFLISGNNTKIIMANCLKMKFDLDFLIYLSLMEKILWH